MERHNAIAKVRFASARAQRVHLWRADGCVVELLCMEVGQETRVTSGAWCYYVATGTAELRAGGGAERLAPGQMGTTEPDEEHTLANAGEGRLVCLAVTPG